MAFAIGCQGQPLVVGVSAQGNGSGGSGSTEPDFGQQCPDLAALRAGDGDCWPTRHVGRWHGFVTGPASYQDAHENLLVYPSNDVLLVIDEAGAGSVTFASAANAREPRDAGADATPTEPEDAGVRMTRAAESDAGTTGEGLVEGFAYALSELRMSGGTNDGRRLDPRVDFSISLAQPGQPNQAATEDRADSSAPGSDAGALGDTLQASLSLSEDGSALRGTLTSERPDRTLATGFELIRQ